jgi:pyruvate kinase
MDRIVRKVEEGTGCELAGGLPDASPDRRNGDLHHALAGAAVRLATQAHAKALVQFTVSGRSAAVLATWRPNVPIFGWTTQERVRRRLCFWRGVHPRIMRRANDLAQMFGDASRELLADALVRPGDVLVFVGGTALKRGSSNTLKVHRLTKGDGRAHSAAKRTT